MTQRARAFATVELIIGLLTVGTVVWARPLEGGPAVFLSIVERVAAGLVPYRDLALEYPPLALLPIMVPRVLAGNSINGYEILFTAMAVCLVMVTAAAVAWLAAHGWSATSRREALLMFLGLALAAMPALVWRFDIFPALLTALALMAVAAGRPAWAGLALGLGTAAKLYPAFLIPVLLAYYVLGRRLRGAALLLFGSTVTVGAICAGLVLLGGPDAFTFLTYQGDRGIEIGSVLGGIFLLAENMFGIEAAVSFGFGSYEVSSSLGATLALPNVLAQVVLGIGLLTGTGVSFVRDRRRLGFIQPTTLVTYLLATLVLVMLANKVLSPQYIAWLLPLGALLSWRQSLLLVAIFALTTFVYPLSFALLRAAEPLAVAALNGRNLLLLVLFIWLVVPRRDGSTGRVSQGPAATGRVGESEIAQDPWPLHEPGDLSTRAIVSLTFHEALVEPVSLGDRSWVREPTRRS